MFNRISSSSNSRNIRLASHAGSWYTDNATELDQQLSQWLSDVPSDESEPLPIKGCKAVIAPHAGYSYSGPAAAWAYKSIDTTGIKRVFIFGPSHHLYLDGCALSRCTEYATPLGNLPLDRQTIQELDQTGMFEALTIASDEAEHSLEMHLPYVRKIFAGQDISIVPIMIGSISKSKEATYGALLAPFLAREDTFCVVSSDFCHWGTRFQYTYYYPSADDAQGTRLNRDKQISSSYPIYKSISKLDHEAMDILSVPEQSAKAQIAHDSFAQYLSRTSNTICGRHPIGVLFGALATLEGAGGAEEATKAVVVKFVRYEQSSECETIRDSSVSYASAWVKF